VNARGLGAPAVARGELPDKFGDTRAGSGISRATAGALAGAEAAQQAMAGLGGAPPTYGLVFASARHDLKVVMGAVCETTGCADLVGCTSAGEFTEKGYTSGGVAVLLLHAPRSAHRIVTADGVRADHEKVARGLCLGFEEAGAEARANGWAHPISILLIDGLADTCERLVGEFLQQAKPFQQIVGGAAGAEDGIGEARLAAGRRVGPDLGVALHVFGPKRWGIGLDHGLKPPSRGAAATRMTVTKVTGSVIEELDGRPAAEAYRRHARDRGVQLIPESVGGYLLKNPLGLYFLDELRAVRVPGGFTEKGGLRCTAAIAAGSTVTILEGEKENLLEAAGNAARQAKAALEGGEAAAVLVFDCGSRGYSLGVEFFGEVAAIRQVFPDTPVVGLLTYGEIARYRGRRDAWHHSTAVVVAIPK
jgi:hypothetical protein